MLLRLLRVFLDLMGNLGQAFNCFLRVFNRRLNNWLLYFHSFLLNVVQNMTFLLYLSFRFMHFIDNRDIFNTDYLNLIIILTWLPGLFLHVDKNSLQILGQRLLDFKGLYSLERGLGLENWGLVSFSLEAGSIFNA